MGTLLLGLLVTGCGKSHVRRDASAAIHSYNEAVALAYRTSNVSPLEGLAGKDEIRRLSVLIGFKRENGIVLESSIEKLEVLDASPRAEGKMAVRTRERWRYQDRPLHPGTPPGTLFVVDMEMEWELVQLGGHWLVEKGKTLKSSYIEPKGYKLESPRRTNPGPAEHRPAAPGSPR